MEIDNSIEECCIYYTLAVESWLFFSFCREGSALHDAVSEWRGEWQYTHPWRGIGCHVIHAYWLLCTSFKHTSSRSVSCNMFDGIVATVLFCPLGLVGWFHINDDDILQRIIVWLRVTYFQSIADLSVFTLSLLEKASCHNATCTSPCRK